MVHQNCNFNNTNHLLMSLVEFYETLIGYIFGANGSQLQLLVNILISDHSPRSNTILDTTEHFDFDVQMVQMMSKIRNI